MIEKVIIISLIVFAIWYSMRPDEIFGKLGDWLEDHLPDKFHPPLFACPVCMGGFYGAILYWAIFHNGVKEWLIVNIATIGFNAIISKMFPDE